MIQAAVQHGLRVAGFYPGAQIFNAGVIKDIRTNLAAPADVRFVIFHRLFLSIFLLHLQFIKLCFHLLHGLVFVLVLRTVVLALRHQSGRDMGNTHRGFRTVNVLTTGAVLLSTVLSHLTGWDVLDGLMGVAVAAFILWSGWGLMMDTLSPLLGESPSPELVEHIEHTVMSYPGVLGVHDLMVHDYGPGHQFASLHIEFPAEADPLEAHDIIDNIERDFLKKDHLQVTIHYDPIVTSDAAVGVLRSRLMEKARQMDPRLSIHDLRIVPGDSHTNVLFDLVFPAGYTGDKDARLAEMCNFVKEQDPGYCCMVKVEQSYASALPEEDQ